jgi:tagaturonate epimerase
MHPALQLKKYSMGIGDRFGYQADAQLKAIISARKKGVEITPVWNKSYREHQIISSDPSEARFRADEAVQKLGWKEAYFVDADHINLKTVDFFVDSCDYFTIDVADFIGRQADNDSLDSFVEAHQTYCGSLSIPGLEKKLVVAAAELRRIAGKYLYAAQEAATIYHHIRDQKKERSFIIEVSMDETETPQTPAELFFILAALAAEKVPLNTIAPKFSGRFNKGVDYVGDLQQFAGEFEQDVAVIRLAVNEFDLRDDLKLSVHSGSDKFSIYPLMRQIIQKHSAGLHLKTAGTTWLEELIGLAESGGPGLAIAKDIYRKALDKYDELRAPYATVIDIDRHKLPAADAVDSWDGNTFAASLRHVPSEPLYNPHFRQLLHVGYKVAAELGSVYLSALRSHRRIIAAQVTENILERHIKALFFN